MPEQTTFGELLHAFRKRKTWSQTELARRMGVHRNTISFWERGEYLPETLASVWELVRVLELEEEEARLLLEARFGTLAVLSLHAVPFPRNPYFTGRQELLVQLHEKLRVEKRVALTQAISGLGGIGKTQTALEYIYRYRDSYHDIFWAAADTPETLTGAFVSLAMQLNLSEKNERSQSKIVTAVQHWLSTHKDWLFVLDNIEDLRMVTRFIPPNRQGAVVLTTRAQVTEPIAQAIELDTLSDTEGALFLLRRTKRLALEEDVEMVSQAERIEAETISRALGGLPLALDQAGAFILETGCALVDFLPLYQQRRLALLGRRGQVPTDHPDSVTTTFSLLFEKVNQVNPTAIELLRFCAFLAADAIPEEIITKGAAQLGSQLFPIASDLLTLNDALEVLRRYSLIRREPMTKMLSVHRLVQAVLKDNLNVALTHLWAEWTVRAVNAVFPEVVYSTWAECQSYLPHALVCAEFIEQEHLVFPEAARLLNQAATYLWQRAQFREAAPLFERAVAIQEQVVGSEHPDIAELLNNLALLYRDQGKYEEAEPLFQQAIRIGEKSLGPGHPTLATRLNNLALVYRDQGKYAEAEGLFQRALVIRKEALGPEDPSTTESFANLAYLYYSLGKYHEAESLFQQALEIVSQQGTNLPFLAICLNNLATVYRALGRYEEAEPLYLQASDVTEKTLGADSPVMATRFQNLANLRIDQGRYEEAEPLFQRVLAILEKTLGTEHTNFASCLANEANLYRLLGRYEEAEPLFRRAIGFIESALGSEHPILILWLNNLALLRMKQQDDTEAEQLLQRAQRLCRQRLGPEHPSMVFLLNSLATLAGKQGKVALAKSLFQQALVISHRYLGLQHPLVAESLQGLAELSYTQGKVRLARQFYRRALGIREQRLGRQHPDTLVTVQSYIAFLRETQQEKELAALEAHFSLKEWGHAR